MRCLESSLETFVELGKARIISGGFAGGRVDLESNASYSDLALGWRLRWWVRAECG